MSDPSSQPTQPLTDRCSIDGCEKPRHDRGWCSMHATRWRVHGDPFMTKTPNRMVGTVEERFWSRVEKTETCWNWTGAATKGKYGRFWLNNRRLLAHRVAWELTHEPLDDEITIDHLCLNKLCVNPEHLEPVSRGENARRWAAKITHCPQNHPYDEVNTRYDKNGKRSCRTCQRDRWRARHGRPPALGLDQDGRGQANG